MESLIQTKQEQFIRLPRTMEISGLGRSTIWAYVKKGKFPAPIKLSERVTVWRLSDVNRWLMEKIQEAKTTQDSSLIQTNQGTASTIVSPKKSDTTVYSKGGSK